MRRLHLSRPDFTAVSSDRSAKRLTTPHFSVTMSRAGVGTAVVVSKKVAKSSVGRHLIKRRVREALAELQSKQQAHSSPNTSRAFSPAGATIVYARAGSAGLPYSAIVTELSSVFPESSTNKK